MARHRSPSSRRAHLGPPLFASPAAAGVGGVARAAVRTTSSSRHAAPPASSAPLRLAATAVVGCALAATAQQALADTLPAVVDGATGLLGAGVAVVPAALTAPVRLAAPARPAAAQPVEAVLAEPQIADAAALVKAAGLQAARQIATRIAAEEAAVAKAPARSAPAQPVGGGVQMLVGRVTSGFGGRWGTTHQGLDIAAPIGTPIHVPEAGTVISSGPASGFGLWVRVRHADGTTTVYGHINRSFVKVGQRVATGDLIAETGNRGQSTGPHLHIGVMVGGSYVNPRPWLDRHDVGY